MVPVPLEILVVARSGLLGDQMAALLRSMPGAGTVHEASDAEGVLRALSNSTIDMVLLDIGLPELAGIELGALLARFADPPAIVLVADDEDETLDVIELSVVDRLAKPVTAERLTAALERAVDHAGRDERDDFDRLLVGTAGKTRLVTRAEVMLVESSGDYSRLHTASGQHLLRTPLATLEAAWAPHGFLRVHRSYLVAIDAIEEVMAESRRGYRVRVAGRELPVSRRHARVFRERVLRPTGDLPDN